MLLCLSGDFFWLAYYIYSFFVLPHGDAVFFSTEDSQQPLLFAVVAIPCHCPFGVDPVFAKQLKGGRRLPQGGWTGTSWKKVVVSYQTGKIKGVFCFKKKASKEWKNWRRRTCSLYLLLL